MQNRYSADVGDFGKFGLLRHLVAGKSYILGINWYLFPDEGHNEDGKFVCYLNKPCFERCDTELHNKLKTVVETNRSVYELEKIGIFDHKTIFFSDNVDFYSDFPKNTKEHKNKRLMLRKEWSMRASKILSNANVLFLDPDNGLQVPSCKSLSQKKSGKFAYFEEIKNQHQDKDFTVIYHHLNRHKNHGSHTQQIQDRAEQLKSKINTEHIVFAVRYRPFSPRAFFIITTPKNEKEIESKLKSFLQSNWGQFWDNYYKI